MIEVSVVIPILNEEKYIEGCLQTIISQDYPKDRLEVLFVDGLSTDRTKEVLRKASDKYKWIRLLDNEKKIIPSAMNIGILNAKGTYIVRMDAHTEYSPDYISKCLEAIKRTRADNVGGPVVARGKKRKQRVIAAAYHSPFALGGGNQYRENYEGEVDTVFLGCYRKDYAIKIGLYDKTMDRNEDDEFNFRIKENAGRIYMTPEIRTVYYPRDSLSALSRQYFHYGEGKPKVLRKHGKPARIRQVVPALFVCFLVLGSIGAIFSSLIRLGFLLILMLYLLMDLGFSMRSTELGSLSEKLLLTWVHFVIHISYGIGYLKGLVFSKRT